MNGRILNQSFGFLTPKEIARNDLPRAVRRARADVVGLERSPRGGTGAMKVFRDPTARHAEDLSGVSAMEDFRIEAEADKNIARTTGNVAAARKLLDGAWDMYLPGIIAEAPNNVLVGPAQAIYAEAIRVINSYAPGGALLESSAASAHGAIVDQNIRYEASGQAAKDREATAREIQGGKFGVLMAEVDDTVSTAGDFWGDAASSVRAKLPPAPDFVKGIGQGALEGLLKPAGYVLGGYLVLKLLRIL